VSNALFRFQLLGEPYAGVTHPRSAGNGCIMRLAPVPMYFAGNREQALRPPSAWRPVGFSPRSYSIH
jgi:ADP-ribosyl-[dinitrogen reductase] hydrolase